MKTKEKRTTTNFVKKVKDDEQEEEKINFNSIQISLYRELNKLRQDPRSYIPYIEAQMKLIKKNNILKKNDSNLQIQTIEGKSAYEEAILFLEEQEPVEPLTKEIKLSYAAQDLVKDIGERGVVSHQDKNGLYTSERIEKYCEWDFCANEVIEVSSKNPQDILVSLLVDDGLRDRPDRRALFQNIYNYVGIACGSHIEYEIVTVFVFAGGIRQKGTLFYQIGSEFELRNFGDDYENYNEKNTYLINDPDAPQNTIGLRVVRTKKYLGNRKIIVNKKFYKLDDGTEHVVELEEF
jgi:uncharacterized protein YkwD